MKQNVEKTLVEDIIDLKKRIEKEIKTILGDVFSNIVKRMDLCIEVDDGHFEHLLPLQLYEIKFHRRPYHSMKEPNESV